MRSPLATLAGETQTSSYFADGKSSSAAKKRSSMSASFSTPDDNIDKQSTSANANNSGGADPAINAMAASAVGGSITSNGSNGSNSSSKRMKLTKGEGGPVIGQFLDVDEDDEDDNSSECNDDTDSPAATSSNAAITEVPAPSSVKKLKGWLSDFERKQKEHYERIPHHSHNNNPNPNVAASSSSATPSRRNTTAVAMARAVPHTDVVKARSTSINSSTSSSSSVKSTATPGRKLFGGTKPRTGITNTSSSSVEATNDGYASVSKLSAWLEDDPTSKKKGMPLAHRRGRNVSLKSRKFEPLPQNDATRTVEFRRNGVSERKQWLESAFKKDDDSKKVGNGDGMSVADRAKWLQGAFAKKEDNGGGGHKVRRDDDGHANVAYAEVGPEEELTSSGRCGDIATATETTNETNNNMNNAREGDSVVSSSTCSSFSIGKQMLESRTEKNSARGAGRRQQDDDDEEDLKASVQSRRAALEKREEESRAHAEQNGGGGRRPVGAVRAHWEVGGSGNSQSYSKTYVPEDDRRCTPAKKLSDLP